MKAFFTSLLILMATYAFSQTTPMYTYIDKDGNKFELYSGLLDYTPKTGTNKKVELSKVATSELETLFKAAIDATADHMATKPVAGGTIKVASKTIYLKATSVPRKDLETKLKSKV